VNSQPVEVGLDNNIQAEILSGVEDGDLVVSAGAVSLANANGSGGMRMRGMGFGG
jgi:macrolide-specific efflux system membrane fusion protein